MRRGACVSEEGRSGVPMASDPLLRKAVASDLEGAGGKLDSDGGLDSRQSSLRVNRKRMLDLLTPYMPSPWILHHAHQDPPDEEEEEGILHHTRNSFTQNINNVLDNEQIS
jgi:hypothetical protein